MNEDRGFSGLVKEVRISDIEITEESVLRQYESLPELYKK